MRIDVFTLFPQVFKPYLETSILHRAIQRNLVQINLHNIRDWTTDKHHVTDDEPYGGGGGMIMKPEPVFAAIEGVFDGIPQCPVILLTPQGRLFNQSVADQLNREPHLVLLSGRYEGIDERVRQQLVTDEISIGDYVLTGGELPALVVIDAVVRLLPGALGDPDGTLDDSHASGLLEYPHYTRPAEYRGWKVPEVLLSGDHERIARWRREQALLRTFQRRPELLDTAQLTEQDQEFISNLDQDETKQDHKKNL